MGHRDGTTTRWCGFCKDYTEHDREGCSQCDDDYNSASASAYEAWYNGNLARGRTYYSDE